MFDLALDMLKEKKYIVQAIVLTFVFLIMYTLIDSFNLSYQEMSQHYGFWLVLVNISLNIIMSTMSALLLNLNAIMVRLKGNEIKASNMSFVSILFGVLTYGCTPCVIGFFANLGISFSVAVLPFAGLPYKFISALLLLFGLWWTKREIEKGVCKVKNA